MRLPQRVGGLTGSSASAVRRFQHRARFYEVLDSRLRAKTRFFGAACVTNRVLVHLASVRLPLADGHICAEWFSDLGASLLTLNGAIAEAVITGRLSGSALDERIVAMEQGFVERSLQRARASRTGAYSEVLPALDALLNHRGGFSMLHFSPVVRGYRRVLAEVRHELGSPIEFARQRHREKIGMALISALRREEGLSVVA